MAGSLMSYLPSSYSYSNHFRDVNTPLPRSPLSCRTANLCKYVMHKSCIGINRIMHDCVTFGSARTPC